jgi:hypothetical protein
MKRLFALVIIVALTASMLATIPVYATQPALPDYEPVDWQSGLAGEVPMPKIGPADYAGGSASSPVDLTSTPPIGTTVLDWYLEALSGAYWGEWYPYMTLRAVSGNVEVWVAQDEMLQFLPGDPRNNDPRDWQVTDKMCQYIADEFNNVIYPKDVQNFGAPFDRDGTNTIFEYYGFPAEYWDWIATDNPQRVIIKIFNIVDNNFFNPNYPSYVVGFYDPTYTQVYYNRNMIHVDNWNYSQRLGPMGYSWYPGRTVTRPYVYESTVAHEFQHDIHADWNPEDPSFMNEGCSMYAELLCGYGIDTSYLNYYFYSPDNSLIEWSDQGDINVLADYGESALWTLYLVDHYGGAKLIHHFVQAGIPGIDGVNAALAYYKYKVRFDDVFHDFRLANLIRADFPGCDKYNYKSLNLNDPAIIPVRQYKVGGLPVPLTRGTSFGTTKTIRGYDTGVSRLAAYGTDYITFENWAKPGFMYFDGDDVALYGWQVTTDGWWSGLGNLMDTKLIGSAYVNPADPTLTLVTKWGIEYDPYPPPAGWDFGFVQVSTDNGQTWTSLANEYTTSDYLTNVQAIIDNLPGLTGYNPDWPDWTTMTFDLTAYAGMNILVDFRYMTDQFTNLEGWFIQDAAVSGNSLTLTATYPPASFQVTVVSAIVTHGRTVYVPLDMWLTKDTNKGVSLAFAQKPSYVVMVVSPTMLHGTVDYKFQVTKTPLLKFFNP